MGWTTLRSARICSTGSVGVAPIRVRALYVLTSTRGAVSITDGTTALLVADYPTSASTYMQLPDAGIYFKNRCSITGPTNCVVTVFYD